ncbi:MAG: PolC-type DNA polymerase III [Clostridia bacterium]|nr:PolC-type DNA polymerase III [Clostridia bacterium]
MTYEQLLDRIYTAHPGLEGKLDCESVAFHRRTAQAYITFLSDVLVGEDVFLSIKRILQKAFPRLRISVRITSPALKDAFLENPTAYLFILKSFLLRNFPVAAAWVDAIGWQMHQGALTLEFPDSLTLKYAENNAIADRLRKAIQEVFRADVTIRYMVKETEQEHPPQLPVTVWEEDERFIAQIIERENNNAPGNGKNGRNREQHLYGRAIGKGNPVPINSLKNDSGVVLIQGDVSATEMRELPGGEKLLVSFILTDDTSSVSCKLFIRYQSRNDRRYDDITVSDAERSAAWDKASDFKENIRIRARGECAYDKFENDLVFTIRSAKQIAVKERMDNAPEKRVELHAHTRMSAMDALTDTKALIERAAQWGHSAVAITDHGVVQAFPAAFTAAKENHIKLIPGCEAYLTQEAEAVCNGDGRALSEPIVVLWLKASGPDIREDRLTAIGAVKIGNNTVIDSVFFQEGHEAAGDSDSSSTGQQLPASSLPEKALRELYRFMEGCSLATHSVAFEYAMLAAEFKRLGLHFSGPVLDTLTIARRMYPQLSRHKLKTICRWLKISYKEDEGVRTAAAALAQCLLRMIEDARATGAESLNQLQETLRSGTVGYNTHIVLLAKNQTGVENLYRIVSQAHLKYHRKTPNIPRHVLQECREGLLLGSACESGELFQAVLNGEEDDKLIQIASFYDYLEIQPTANNLFLIDEGRVKDEETLRDMNRKLFELGERLAKPVIAAGDVHFLEPRDAVFRAVIQDSQGYKDSDRQPPLYFKTTEEMLEAFSYLGAENALKVVVTNPRRIAESVSGQIRLFPELPEGKETFQPYIPGSEEAITSMARERAREWYGNELPEIVSDRLEQELDAITRYDFSTLYFIACRLVSTTVANGFAVGSRGSVGSSFAARMCGITEVNPLPPHYRCRACRKGYFDEETGAFFTGPDMPDRTCPECGEKLIKDGYHIPFEVFLGFKGDKVPDIDLNFPGEYQATAHKHVEEIVGDAGRVYRAGTINKLAEKTTQAYARKFLEKRDLYTGEAEVKRLAAGCTGVKKTTGQHPGGMVIIPSNYDVYSFTAMQHPADNPDKGIITTHIDFESMHDTLVKLDILGHDNPSMIYELENLTHIRADDLPLDDPQCLSLFTGPEALGVSAEDIGCATGTLGIPEFGTEFVRGMLEETKPKTVQELICISGLSHGTNVWRGNTQDIIKAGIAPLKDCICTREDIMLGLIRKGVDTKMAFDTMEHVRRGKGLTPAMEEAMLEAGVSAWFIDSCKKIQYMFPKGHAVAYVMGALRIAWYKIYRPTAYYAAYFTIRGDGFDATRMLSSPNVIRETLEGYRTRKQKITAKERTEIIAWELVLEMRLRGISFLPCDLYKSDVSRFIIEDENLRVPFTSLTGVGATAAQNIVKERETPFISIEDLKKRAKVPSDAIALLRTHGCLRGLDEYSQVSMF